MGTKALLVGINAYKGSPLNGCINDVVGLREILTRRYGVSEDRMRILTDAQATRAGIEDGLRWLARPDDDGKPGVRLFHFSGHGTYMADATGDEPDGRDECIVPFDYATARAMSDDTLRKQYATFGGNTHLLLLMDCCHSGSVSRGRSRNVRFRFLPGSYEEERRIDEAAQRFKAEKQAFVAESLADLRDRVVPEDEWQRRIQEAMTAFDKKHFGQQQVAGNVVLMAACKDSQTAADASFGQSYHGAFSFYLSKALRKGGSGLTYRSLIDEVSRNLYDNKFRQMPQLTCSSANLECQFLNVAL